MSWRGLAIAVLCGFVATVMGVSGVFAQQPAKDITEEVIVGPGSVSVATKKDVMMSFGALVRFIPTSESNWDFGMSDNLEGKSFFGGKYSGTLFETHSNESGTVRGGYIRNEDKIYFNAMPQDRKWSFYAALEYDRPIDTDTVDNRGGRGDSSNFGLERLNVSVALPYETRLHAGWDVWGFDHYDGASMVYADDNPGFWLDGTAGKLTYSIGYFKLAENNFQTSLTGTIGKYEFAANDDDRDLIAAYADYKINDKHKVKFFYGYDRIRAIPVRDFYTAAWGAARSATGISMAKVYDLLGLDGSAPDPSDPDFPFAYGAKYTVSAGSPKTDSHHVGSYYVGNFGPVELFLEGAYQFGSADNVQKLKYSSYDISAYALAADVALELKDWVGFSVKPHVGVMYTSGDDDPNDDKLEGYNGIENAQRFSNRWGGENTIIGDTNFVLGTALYGYLPEFYGNGTPIFTGGLQNFAGYGNGRGDNPGLTMLSVGLTASPKKFIIYRTNLNNFWWNEDIKVKSFVYPYGETWVKSGYVGSEWDNELTVALHKNVFVKGQVSFFFPGEVIEDVTAALGAKSDDTASRVAAELIWNF
uniref:Alginate export domain-containing protein n=1 Tax=Desulfacinum infernum TaxID=35837 RepID=A0A832A7F7_9BACT